MRRFVAIHFCIILSSVGAVGAVGALNPAKMQSGDLIFHQSNGFQAQAIQEAQGSPYTHMGLLFYENKQWYVYEAVQPVRRTALAKWIRRGKGGHYIIKRVRADLLDMSLPSASQALLQKVKKYLNYDYDIFFQWNDEAIYCSELVFKSYLSAFALKIGRIQKLKDLNLEGPTVRRLIKEREKLLGEPVNYEEPIITPVRIMEAEELETVDVF